MSANMDIGWLVIYAIPFLGITAYYVRHRRRVHARHRQTLQEAIAAGKTQPASLPPLIDPSKCLGARAFITPGPQTPPHDVARLLYGQAELLNPAACLGHRAR